MFYIDSKGDEFNKQKPLWVCHNSINIDHSCNFVKCNNFYELPNSHTSHSNKGKGICNHAFLEIYDNLQYFKNTGIAFYEDDENCTNICVVCKKEIMVY